MSGPVQTADEEIRDILANAHTVAVVGLSPKPDRPSYEVASYLKGQGYRIVPVNPTCQEVLGEPCYPTLQAIPHPVDVVDIFRRSEEVPPYVEAAIDIAARVVWMPEGVVNEAAAARARQAGLKVVMDRCMKKEHQRTHIPKA